MQDFLEEGSVEPGSVVETAQPFAHKPSTPPGLDREAFPLAARQTLPVVPRSGR